MPYRAGTKRRNTAPASQLEDVVSGCDFGPHADQDNLHVQQDPLQPAEAAAAAGQALDSSTQELSLHTHLLRPMAAGQPSSLPNQFELPTHFHVHFPGSPAFSAIPRSLHQQPSNYLDFPPNVDASGWFSDEMHGLSSDDVREYLASAQIPQQTAVHEEGDDATSGENQLAVIQPAIQHVVLSFLAKMRALVAKRRMQRGETASLSVQLDQRLRLCACVATWTRCKLILSQQ